MFNYLLKTELNLLSFSEFMGQIVSEGIVILKYLLLVSNDMTVASY